MRYNKKTPPPTTTTTTTTTTTPPTTTPPTRTTTNEWGGVRWGRFLISDASLQPINPKGNATQMTRAGFGGPAAEAEVGACGPGAVSTLTDASTLGET